MGACCSSSDRVQPSETSTTQLDHSTRSIGSVEEEGITRRRNCTDVCFLLIFGFFVIALLGLVGYCALKADIYRIINGYDDYGCVCGRDNTDLKECPNPNKINDRYLLLTADSETKRDCVSICPPHSHKVFLLKRCIPVRGNFTTGVPEFLQEFIEDIEVCKMQILYLFLISFGFSVVIIILFRFLVGIIVWLLLIGVMIVSLGGTIYLWFLWNIKKKELQTPGIKEINERSVNSFLAYAILATIATVIIFLIILVMRKRIKLVVQLFKEAGKAVASMPIILFEPFLTFIILGLVMATWIYFGLIIESSGYLEPINGTQKKFLKKDIIMKIARWYNLFAFLWFIQFCNGCQHMVISGAVAKWFFTREKKHLGTPILRSFFNLIRYHLGSVALGSLLIAIVQMVRIILKFIESRLKGYNNSISKCLFRMCQCCLYCFEKILQFLTRNAYIEIAIHGHSFCRAGQQAFKLLATNALRVAAINSVGDFVLFLGKILVVIATVLIGIQLVQDKGVMHIWVPLSLAAVFAYIVAHCFITVYEMAIDTIFICFCEDCEQNDGLSRHYFMSRGLMEFVENSKKALAALKESQSPDSKSEAWNISSRNLTR